MRYLLFNKPDQVMPAFTDPEGRATLKDFIDVPEVYAAGRLDYDSEGLMILTDDGEVIHRITDPRFDHPKTYLVQVEGVITPEALDQLRRGIPLRDGLTKPAYAEAVPDPGFAPRARGVRHYHPTPWLKLVLREGKKRQVRRMTAAVGLPCLRLVRTAIGPFTLEPLAPGQWRELTRVEQHQLRRSLQLKA